MCTLILKVLNVDHGSDRSTMANSEYLCFLMHLRHCVFLSAYLFLDIKCDMYDFNPTYKCIFMIAVTVNQM